MNEEDDYFDHECDSGEHTKLGFEDHFDDPEVESVPEEHLEETEKTEKEEKIEDILPKGRGKYYLTNKDLLPAVIEAKKKGYLTNELAKMLMLLTDRYSRKSNFVGYTYREDMVSEALVNLSKNALKFDPERSSNPFAFYTTAIKRSFLQYMADEKKHRFIRDSLLVAEGANPSYNYTGYLTEKERKEAEEKTKNDKESKRTEGDEFKEKINEIKKGPGRPKKKKSRDSNDTSLLNFK